jgi:hypothetical protein
MNINRQKDFKNEIPKTLQNEELLGISRIFAVENKNHFMMQNIQRKNHICQIIISKTAALKFKKTLRQKIFQ